jgi:hypothetical protein
VPTTDWLTSNVSLWSSTVSAGMLRRINEDLRQQQGQPVPHGTPQKPGGSGIPAWPLAQKVGRSGSVWSGLVSIAAWFRRCWTASRGVFSGSAPRPVRRLHIVAVERLNARADTWCIHVPDVECFTLASGAIVHNSHGADAFRYLATRQKTPVEKQKTVMAPRYNSGGTGWMGVILLALRVIMPCHDYPGISQETSGIHAFLGPTAVRSGVVSELQQSSGSWAPHVRVLS